jgi:diaminopimelate decarboxylase
LPLLSCLSEVAYCKNKCYYQTVNNFYLLSQSNVKKDNLLDFFIENKKKWVNNTPCFIINKKQLLNTVENIKRLLPGEILYSFKTNSHPFIAKTISAEKCGFLLSSMEEVQKLINYYGADPKKILFQSPSLTDKQFKKIKLLGIHRFVIDSWKQLELITSSLGEFSQKPELLVRINTGVKINKPELNYSSDSFLGFPIKEAGKVFENLNILRNKDLITLGLHNHLLSQNTYLRMWKKNMDVIGNFVKELKTNNIKLDIVDFGGGCPIEYSSPVPSLEELSKIILKTTKKIKTIYPHIHFIFEPGRKVVGESISLVTQVVHKKKFLDQNIAILDCSVYSASLDTLIVNLHLRAKKIEESKKIFEDYVLRGSTPDSLDVFSRKVSLPELKSGDHIVFPHAGAYSFSSDFISLKKPNYIII